MAGRKVVLVLSLFLIILLICKKLNSFSQVESVLLVTIIGKLSACLYVHPQAFKIYYYFFLCSVKEWE